MSYILDALRKSEEERKKSRVPPARPGYTFIKDDPPARKRKLAFGLILTSCLLAVILILSVGWWWSLKLESVPQVMNEQPHTSESALDEMGDSSSERSPEIFQTTAVPSAIEPPPPIVPTAEMPYLTDMSGDFQNKVPELKFSGHVYSIEPEQRMIMINDAVVREGELIGIDLTLEEITENGVILILDQTRFRIKLF